MKISRQWLGFRSCEVECEFIVVPRRRCATSRIQYVAQCHCVFGVRRSEQRQNVRTFRPSNIGTPRCPETPNTNHLMTLRLVKSFKIETDYIYLRLNSKDSAE
jgi:hypothetical protein